MVGLSLMNKLLLSRFIDSCLNWLCFSEKIFDQPEKLLSFADSWWMDQKSSVQLRKEKLVNTVQRVFFHQGHSKKTWSATFEFFLFCRSDQAESWEPLNRNTNSRQDVDDMIFFYKMSTWWARSFEFQVRTLEIMCQSLKTVKTLL